MSKQRLGILILLLIDIAIVAVSPFLALVIRFDGAVPNRYYNQFWDTIPFILVISIAVYMLFGLYHRLWRYASIRELVAIVGAATMGTAILVLAMYVFNKPFPRSVVLINWFLTITLIGASRFLARLRVLMLQKCRGAVHRVLIIGAGDAGAMIAREIQQHYWESKKVIGFVDDNPYKIDKTMLGVKVLGNYNDLNTVIRDNSVNEVIIAMPSARGEQIKKYVTACKNQQCKVKIAPGVYDIIEGTVSVTQLRDVQVEDLLGRDPVRLNIEEISHSLKGKVVLVTGAGGSIGSELCRQIIKMNPSHLILLGKGENSIYDIHNELQLKYAKVIIAPVIADVRDAERIRNVFATYQPQVVFHAAAHKHVPLMEEQPEEAVRNNVFGTKVLVEAADRFSVETFILISTDKAVNPTSVMGATKRVAELIIQNMNEISKTRFAAVRFGNVLGSRGSVIPVFKRQIAQGGPVTITHPDMQRYFMTIPEASQLVLQAGSMSKGGEVFVLDMGEPVKIVDMACDLIELSGYTPYKDIKINFIGLRPGEKLFEELLTAEEGTSSTKHEKIFVANIREIDAMKLGQALRSLSESTESNRIIHILMSLVPTYKSARIDFLKTKVV